jgi:hypothetical protein
VPLVIPLAWTMMAYPALLVAGASRPPAGGPVAALALATWDLFLDPQMVDAGHWVWLGGGGPTLLGIPLSNFAGWLVTRRCHDGAAVAAPAGVGRRAWRTEARPTTRARRALPVGVRLLGAGHAAFFGLPGSALLGGVGMGAVVALPFVVAVLRR